MTEKTLTYDDLLITDSDLYDEMGYRGTAPDEATCREATAITSEVRRWLMPRLCYRVIKDLPPFRLGRIITRQLRGSEAYALFVCTAGMEFEEYQRRLADEGDMVRVFIANALGSVIAEHCADRMEDALQVSINKLGWHHTNRFSPGYCGWSVAEQHLLFNAIANQPLSPTSANTPANSQNSIAEMKSQGVSLCGVHLTDSALMIPIKSVSGVIGLGTNVRKREYSCGLCDSDKCYKKIRKQ